ncbi:hypothetical protein [Flavobacterium sp. WC2429]|uniref:Uncharacterized protein n=1 Tax=Flavobacterium sp. WC2429 TaxID=3234140 RepID=A0AB39WMX0_9FLAO
MDFKKHALIFFEKYKRHTSENNIENNFEHDSLNYVRKENDFKYKDDVDAGVLVMILEELEYLKFTNRHNEKRYHIITEKGFEFLSKIP